MLRKASVRDYMSDSVISIRPSMSIHEAVRKMMDHRVTAVPVTDSQGHLVGILSERECIRAAYNAGYNEDQGGTVADHMSQEIPTISPGMSILDVTERFMKEPHRSYPVMENGRMIGVISRVDILAAMVAMA